MFENFYGLSGSPFRLTPDARFFYASAPHRRAIAHLTYGLSQGEGFVVITGEVGAGKTMLVERLCADLDPDTHTLVRINTTQLSGDELLRLVLAGFGAAAGGTDKAAMLLEMEATLRAQHAAGRRCLLVVDEVQNLSHPALEELRMLSNLTGAGRASLQTILLGQPQFRRTLAAPALDQLRQRVLASYFLASLEPADTRAYVEHRLSTAGWTGAPEIELAAFHALHRHSGGIPRRINRLCGRVLLHGALAQAATLTAEMVDTVAEELDHDLHPGAAEATVHEAAPETMLERIELLELKVAQRERTLQRLKSALTALP
jgi:putative secretion ATPase (PEP-CTERM system associated)